MTAEEKRWLKNPTLGKHEENQTKLDLQTQHKHTWKKEQENYWKLCMKNICDSAKCKQTKMQLYILHQLA